MYELVKLTDHDYYIDCPAKIGVVLTDDGSAVLIDGGSDKDAGKKAYRILQDNNWPLKAIFNTHSHADHIGGNHFLQEKTSCKIYAAGLECTYTNSPSLETAGLYGGLPFKDLRHKFLMAQESTALPITDDVLPDGMTVIPLPGHSFEMVGFLTKDGTAYVADCVSSEETLSKYGMSYLWDPEASLRTLEYVKTVPAKRFVPAHAPVTEDISALAKLNADSITSVEEKLISLCSTPSAFEDILKKIFDAYGLVMTPQQYALIGSTVRSYLSSLYERGRLSFSFIENRMLWSAE